MKLYFDKTESVWKIGEAALNCGQQVKILCCDVNGDAFYVYGRFEIAGLNNPVFYTTFGRIVPDLQDTRFIL
jgi:hypothetical protein